MGLFKRAHVRGINFELIRRGLISYPNEKIADETADAVADNIPAPEEIAEQIIAAGGTPEEAEAAVNEVASNSGEVLPEVSGEEGLTEEEAANVIQQLADVADEIAQQTGGEEGAIKGAALRKLASSVDYEQAAHAHAVSVMEKAAEEYGTTVTGDGRFQETIMEGEGQVDADTNPSSDKVGPQGTTDLNADAGAVGAERPQDETPGPTDVTPSEVAKLSMLLRKLSQADGQAQGTAPGSGNTGAIGRQELTTNIDMSGVAPAVGTTVQPSGPMIGQQTENPAVQGTSPATPGEVAKLSSALIGALNRLSKRGEEDETGVTPPSTPPPSAEEKTEEEKKKEEEAKNEEGNGTEEKEASARQFLDALRVVAKHMG